MATDHELAHLIARDAADRLALLQAELHGRGADHWNIEQRGDREAHSWIAEALHTARPDDAVLSEEGDDDRSRVSESRVWIVDPLDGSSGFGYGGPEWAVHVALTIDGVAKVGAVASPGIGFVGSTHEPPVSALPHRSRPLIVTGWSRAQSDGALIASVLDGESAACSSAGFKAAIVATGQADVYVHNSPLYEWDVCAPAAMAEACGLSVTDALGEPLRFNQAKPVVNGFVVCRPEFQVAVLSALDERRDLLNGR